MGTRSQRIGRSGRGAAGRTPARSSVRASTQVHARGTHSLLPRLDGGRGATGALCGASSEAVDLRRPRSSVSRAARRSGRGGVDRLRDFRPRVAGNSQPRRDRRRTPKRYLVLRDWGRSQSRITPTDLIIEASVFTSRGPRGCTTGGLQRAIRRLDRRYDYRVVPCDLRPSSIGPRTAWRQGRNGPGRCEPQLRGADGRRDSGQRTTPASSTKSWKRYGDATRSRSRRTGSARLGGEPRWASELGGSLAAASTVEDTPPLGQGCPSGHHGVSVLGNRMLIAGGHGSDAPPRGHATWPTWRLGGAVHARASWSWPRVGSRARLVDSRGGLARPGALGVFACAAEPRTCPISQPIPVVDRRTARSAAWPATPYGSCHVSRGGGGLGETAAEPAADAAEHAGHPHQARVAGAQSLEDFRRVADAPTRGHTLVDKTRQYRLRDAQPPDQAEARPGLLRRAFEVARWGNRSAGQPTTASGHRAAGAAAPRRQRWSADGDPAHVEALRSQVVKSTQAPHRVRRRRFGAAVYGQAIAGRWKCGWSTPDVGVRGCRARPAGGTPRWGSVARGVGNPWHGGPLPDAVGALAGRRSTDRVAGVREPGASTALAWTVRARTSPGRQPRRPHHCPLRSSMSSRWAPTSGSARSWPPPSPARCSPAATTIGQRLGSADGPHAGTSPTPAPQSRPGRGAPAGLRPSSPRRPGQYGPFAAEVGLDPAEVVVEASLAPQLAACRWSPSSSGVVTNGPRAAPTIHRRPGAGRGRLGPGADARSGPIGELPSRAGPWPGLAEPLDPVLCRYRHRVRGRSTSIAWAGASQSESSWRADGVAWWCEPMAPPRSGAYPMISGHATCCKAIIAAEATGVPVGPDRRDSGRSRPRGAGLQRASSGPPTLGPGWIPEARRSFVAPAARHLVQLARVRADFGAARGRWKRTLCRCGRGGLPGVTPARHSLGSAGPTSQPKRPGRATSRSRPRRR